MIINKKTFIPLFRESFLRKITKICLILQPIFHPFYPAFFSRTPKPAELQSVNILKLFSFHTYIIFGDFSPPICPLFTPKRLCQRAIFELQKSQSNLGKTKSLII